MKAEINKGKNNCIWGKFTEDVWKYLEAILVLDPVKLQREVCKPTFKNGIILGEDVNLATHAKQRVKLNKPGYVANAILDLSKMVSGRSG